MNTQYDSIVEDLCEYLEVTPDGYPKVSSWLEERGYHGESVGALAQYYTDEKTAHYLTNCS